MGHVTQEVIDPLLQQLRIVGVLARIHAGEAALHFAHLAGEIRVVADGVLQATEITLDIIPVAAAGAVRTGSSA